VLALTHSLMNREQIVRHVLKALVSIRLWDMFWRPWFLSDCETLWRPWFLSDCEICSEGIGFYQIVRHSEGLGFFQIVRHVLKALVSIRLWDILKALVPWFLSDCETFSEGLGFYQIVRHSEGLGFYQIVRHVLKALVSIRMWDTFWRPWFLSDCETYSEGLGFYQIVRHVLKALVSIISTFNVHVGFLQKITPTYFTL
jgi:hypothetical protein